MSSLRGKGFAELSGKFCLEALFLLIKAPQVFWTFFGIACVSFWLCDSLLATDTLR